MTIGERIRQRRIELKMTQDELAKKVGYKSRSSIQKIEVARALPLRKVSKMASALDCSPGYLMGWNEDTPSIQDQYEAYIMKIIDMYKKASPEAQAEVVRILKASQ